MTIEKETEEIKSKESEVNKRRNLVPVEVHRARSSCSYAISETSEESSTS